MNVYDGSKLVLGICLLILPALVIIGLLLPNVLNSPSNVSVYFTEQEPLTNLAVNFISSSDTFLYVSALDVSHPAILSALRNLQSRGVDVKVITEKAVVGLPSKIDASKGLHHVKFMVNDHGVLFGSANFSISGLETGLNDILVFPRSYTQRFKEFFLYIWNYGKIGTVKDFLVSPVDNAEGLVLKSIQKAHRRIYICMYAFTDKNILTAIKWKQSQGVDVRIVTDKWFLDSHISKYLRNHAKVINKRMLHHKFIIVDNQLFTGSTNYTESGFHRNVEMIWSTKNRRIVKLYEQVFEALTNGSW